ncbi:MULTISPECIES: iron uptake transporter deferrochelatase/peroxidase subunit [unclassified Rathayibacter]|uniref:iron uptake transporter deferrochelatase/peroxidase subunit n=2 Tax=Rathayibacter TaxID=33886 RepID=UPI000CE8BF42|nr:MULTISPECIES: iron uptake transporter deferrochelatase/peroxidase subunit [unclassified Rathayibacter]PPF12777.1 deferrochelatase/peroxidase EfeB [Rathayibacter sp. AY1A5]PPF73766.1 deferrochelatase/peroxidase EfeB [Rathayibacter sp. AY1E6]PPH84860.1 deferrochelatase/peroxidase EfeB [Rathayibacter sp. AY1D9]
MDAEQHEGARPTESEQPADEPRRLSRRGLLGLVSAGTAGLAAGVGGTVAVTSSASATASSAPRTVPFFGANQAGITTAAQDRLHFAAFDLAAGTTREDLVELLKDWTLAASRMTQGLEVGENGAVDGPDTAPPEDTGEALGLDAASLTVTVGFGPTLFTDESGADRFGLADRRPPQLQALPRFRGDALVPSAGGGDLCIQACADDPQVAVHAIRNLSRIAFGRASLRWSQLGFGRTSSTSTAQATPRNLFGFKDGTANVKSEEADAVQEHVWVPSSDGPAWMVGGSYLVARKIRMIIETWDRSQLGEQERVIGRSKGSGAPLSGGTESTEPDFAAAGATGAPLIDQESHVRLAHPSVNNGVRLLRRGYNFVDGNDELGRLNAGLFFLSFQRSPEQFVTVQRNLATDALNEYVKHVGSAVFAVPPGARDETDFLGSGLFA